MNAGIWMHGKRRTGRRDGKELSEWMKGIMETRGEEGRGDKRKWEQREKTW